MVKTVLFIENMLKNLSKAIVGITALTILSGILTVAERLGWVLLLNMPHMILESTFAISALTLVWLLLFVAITQIIIAHMWKVLYKKHYPDISTLSKVLWRTERNHPLRKHSRYSLKEYLNKYYRKELAEEIFSLIGLMTTSSTRIHFSGLGEFFDDWMRKKIIDKYKTGEA